MATNFPWINHPERRHFQNNHSYEFIVYIGSDHTWYFQDGIFGTVLPVRCMFLSLCRIYLFLDYLMKVLQRPIPCVRPSVIHTFRHTVQVHFRLKWRIKPIQRQQAWYKILLVLKKKEVELLGTSCVDYYLYKSALGWDVASNQHARIMFLIYYF